MSEWRFHDRYLSGGMIFSLDNELVLLCICKLAFIKENVSYILNLLVRMQGVSFLML